MRESSPGTGESQSRAEVGPDAIEAAVAELESTARDYEYSLRQLAKDLPFATEAQAEEALQILTDAQASIEAEISRFEGALALLSNR